MTPHYPLRSSGPQPPHFRGITVGRLNQFVADTSERSLHSTLDAHRTDAADVVKLEHWPSPHRERIPFHEAVRQRFAPFHKGSSIGPSWTQHWFRIHVNVPSAFKNEERVVFEFDPSCEGLVFDEEGLPLQAITGGFGIDRRVDVILETKKRTQFKLYIACSCNGMFGNGLGETNNPPDDKRYFNLASADLVVPRMDAFRLLYDFITIRDLAAQMPENSPLGNLALEVGNAICNKFRSDDLSTIDGCRQLAEKVLGAGWEKKGAKIYDGDAADAQTWAIGNCHIDTAWLWPFSATRDKAARSWSSQLDLMNRYEEYTFVASQAQQFAWVEQDYPLLFNEIKAKVASGQFQPIGGSWVEFDANMPSGESFARQFLYGQRYFKSRFGEYSTTFWLPDTFGYSPALPQLCQLAGMSSFFTQKLSWSQFNNFPHSTFSWVGQDGTQVLTHMTPVDTYTAQASVEDVRKSINNHKSLQSGAATGLLAYGNGDGGGGVCAPMIENLRRCRAVANMSGELPKVHSGASVQDFYDDVLVKTDGGKSLASWKGELYLELHRGTFTSHGSIKRGNRKSEILLREIEIAATIASLVGHSINSAGKKAPYFYPKSAIDELWQSVLLCQFHDVLPGSSIGMVYEDAEKIYATVQEQGAILLEEALQVVYPSSHSLAAQNEPLTTLFAFNSTPFARRDLVKISLETLKSLPVEVDVQFGHDGSAYVLLEGAAGEMTCRIAEPKSSGGVRATKFGDSYILSNEQLEVKINSAGRITSIHDKNLDRELILADHTAGFVIFEDRPQSWDAWEVDIGHLEMKSDIDASSVRIVEEGPMRATLLATYHFGGSSINAYISLDAFSSIPVDGDISAIRIDTHVDWHETHRFLKFELPTTIQSDFATYENAFGCISRPTTRNTTWERAKFEVVGHKFCDLSEFGYGVALIDESKYGHACEGSTMRLSLLRGPTVPDANCDQGAHSFSFAIAPHVGTFAESSIPQAAILFNNPLHLRSRPTPSASSELIPIGNHGHTKMFSLRGDRNVFLETIKRGEEDHFGCAREARGHEKTVVLRIYEAYGGRGVSELITSLPIKSIKIVDLLERDVLDAPVLKINKLDDSLCSVKFAMRGFEVLTLMLTLDGALQL